MSTGGSAFICIVTVPSNGACALSERGTLHGEQRRGGDEAKRRALTLAGASGPCRPA